MSQLMALSVSIAVLGAIWAFIALGPLSGYALVWAGFIAWGCFFHSGGDTKALAKTIVGTIYGAILGWIALLVIVKVPVPALGTVWPALVVGFFVFFLVIVASVDLLSVVPANVYGFAALVGYTLSKGATGDLTASSAANPLVLLIISLVLGALFGYASGQASNALAGRKLADRQKA
ncbi:DUF1097 domain-containing protein [Methylovirgula sp. HY1]|uniref:DUF1097 domain-containing protein n=1 Tax=Methylovirgula sp. HY1 TaxID=2822761 RepID=UPI001C5B2C00|nr:DUF1097 domain-containing protein [Methylovirgula sp. HY1]QXX74815.1 hypothetical protein MHY1_01632 [Methylovirgula sp. HY1]